MRRRTFLARLNGLAVGACASRIPIPPVAAAEAGGFPIAGLASARGDTDYELRRQSTVWQTLKPERRPDLIVQARNEADVVETLRYARARRMPVAVRGGGHSYSATFLREGGILLDVSLLRGVDLHADDPLARIGPGIRSGELSGMLAEYGRAFPVAHVDSVPLGGYLLGGGIGWNGDWWGRAACLNVRALDLITAQGERLTVGPDAHKDLYWAARGAGPAFCAVATRFHLSTYPLPRAMHAAVYVFHLDALATVAAWLGRIDPARHPNLELTLVLETDAGAIAAGDDGRRCVVSATAFAPDLGEARATLGALARSAPTADALEHKAMRPVGFTDLFTASNTGVPRRIAGDNIWTDRPLAALTQLGAHFAGVPSPHTVVIANLRAHGEPGEDAAFSRLGRGFLMWFGAWDEPDRDADNLGWMQEAAELTTPFATGSYVNEADLARRPGRLALCYSPAARRRLREVSARYDPRTLLPPPFAL